MNEWPLPGSEELQKGCAEVDVGGERVYGCVVLEESVDCPGARNMVNSSHMFDYCDVPKDKEEAAVAKLESAQEETCYCQSSWTYLGKQYSGCEKAADAERSWCFVIVDDRLCPSVNGYATQGEEAGMRWKYCESAESAPVAEAPVPAAEAGESGTIYVVHPVVIPQPASPSAVGGEQETYADEPPGVVEPEATETEAKSSAPFQGAPCRSVIAIACVALLRSLMGCLP
jgi:hypothetical protein